MTSHPNSEGAIHKALITGIGDSSSYLIRRIFDHCPGVKIFEIFHWRCTATRNDLCANGADARLSDGRKRIRLRVSSDGTCSFIFPRFRLSLLLFDRV